MIRMAVGALGQQGSESYADVVAATSPTYFWPLQSNLVASHGGVNLTDSSSPSVGYITGPAAQDSDVGADSDVGDLRAAGINANESGGDGFSYGGWFRIDTLVQPEAIMGNFSNPGGVANGSTVIQIGTTQFRFIIEDEYSTFATGISADTWHHLIFTVDSADKKMRYYRDGALIYTSSAFTTITLGDREMMNILAYGNGISGADGAAAWIGWWNSKTLSLAEVESLAGV